MKIKVFAAIAAVTILGISSCSKKSNSNSDKEYTPQEKAFGDSIAVALGHTSGLSEYQQLQRMWNNMSEYERNNFDKNEFIKGLELVLNSDTANIAYLNGIYTGLNLFNPVYGTATETGCPVSPDKVIAAFKEVYMADSVSMTQAAKYQSDYQEISMMIRDRINAKKAAEQANVIAANKAEGKAYMDQMAKEGFKTTESGLMYKINKPGNGNVKPEDKIAIKYVGKHVNGEVFDQTNDEAYTSQANMFIPGFNEGLTLIGEGGEITLIIPSDIAYGDNGAAPKIAPGETIVFDLTVEKIN